MDQVVGNEMVQALGVIVGLVIVAVLVIRASSAQSAYATRSMESVVKVMAGSIHDDMRAMQERIHEDLRSYQGQVSEDQRVTRERVAAIDQRVTQAAAGINLIREQHGSRIGKLEQKLNPPKAV